MSFPHVGNTRTIYYWSPTVHHFQTHAPSRIPSQPTTVHLTKSGSSAGKASGIITLCRCWARPFHSLPWDAFLDLVAGHIISLRKPPFACCLPTEKSGGKCRNSEHALFSFNTNTLMLLYFCGHLTIVHAHMCFFCTYLYNICRMMQCCKLSARTLVLSAQITFPLNSSSCRLLLNNAVDPQQGP